MIVTHSLVIVMSQDNEYKEWLKKSIEGGLIECCLDSDIVVDHMPIGHGGYGVVHKAKMKHSGITVARKTLFQDSYYEKELNKEFVREVTHYLYCLNNCYAANLLLA